MNLFLRFSYKICENRCLGNVFLGKIWYLNKSICEQPLFLENLPVYFYLLKMPPKTFLKSLTFLKSYEKFVKIILIKKGVMIIIILVCMVVLGIIMRRRP